MGGGIVTTIIKVLDIQNATLNVTTAGRRLPLARFQGKIEITEKQNNVPKVDFPAPLFPMIP